MAPVMPAPITSTSVSMSRASRPCGTRIARRLAQTGRPVRKSLAFVTTVGSSQTDPLQCAAVKYDPSGRSDRNEMLDAGVWYAHGVNHECRRRKDEIALD